MAAHPLPPRSRIRVAGLAAGLLFAAGSAALAQGYGSSDAPPYAGPPENVIVTAPRFHEDSGPRPLDVPPARISLSTAVPAGDLDLTTPGGARALRVRVRHAAHAVCGELRDAYPLYQLPGTSCLREALQNGLVKADEAIADARYQAWEDNDPYSD